MLTKSFALLHLWLFFNLSSEDPEVQHVMVQVMLDLLLRYNFTDEELLNAYNPFADEVDENGEKVQGKLNLTNAKLVDHIFGIFKETEDLETKKVVIEGMCKLLMTNKLAHKKKEVLREFILLFQTPDNPKEQTEMDLVDSINQILAMFFPCYYRRSVNVSEGSKQTLLRVLVECIMEISTRPLKHAFRTIKKPQLIKYVLWLLEEKAGAADDSADSPHALHQRLAYLLLQNIKQPSLNVEAKRAFCQVLVQLDLSGNFPSQLIAVHELFEQITTEDKPSKRDLLKFGKTLKDALAALKKEGEEGQVSVVEPDFFREEDVEYAENIQKEYSELPIERAKRRSIPLMQSPGQTPTQMRGRKRKLTNLQKGNFSEEEEEEEESEDFTEFSEPTPKRKRRSKTPKTQKKKLSPKSKSQSPKKSSQKRRSSLADSKKKSNKKSSKKSGSKKKSRKKSPSSGKKSSRKKSPKSGKKNSRKKSPNSAKNSRKKSSASRSKKSSKRKRLSPVRNNRVSKKRKKLDLDNISTDNTDSNEKENACLNLEDDDFASLFGSSEVDDEIEALLRE